jgi:hypothetical protein
MVTPMADSPPATIPPNAPEAPTEAGQAALAEARALARQAAAPATLRAYKADWQHFARWCAAAGLSPVPAEPAVVGAYLASLAATHAPSTMRSKSSCQGMTPAPRAAAAKLSTSSVGPLTVR